MMPVDFETDREILDAALPTIGLTEPPDAQDPVDSPTRWTWPKSNARRSTWTKPADAHDLEIISDLRDIPFDTEGNLPKSVHDVTELAGGRR